MSLIQSLVSDTSSSIYNDLWKAITDMFDKDGIDYMNEKDSIRVGMTKDSSTLFYKDKPYCAWSTPKMDFGNSDEKFVTIRMEILLKKL